MEADDRRTDVFSVYMINATFPDPANGILQVGDDLADVAAALTALRELVEAGAVAPAIDRTSGCARQLRP